MIAERLPVLFDLADGERVTITVYSLGAYKPQTSHIVIDKRAPGGFRKVEERTND